MKLTTKRGPALALAGPRLVFSGEPGASEWRPSKKAGKKLAKKKSKRSAKA